MNVKCRESWPRTNKFHRLRSTGFVMKSECTVTGISNANSLRLPWSIQPTKTSFPLYVDNSIMYQPDG